jgi:hypothetical protein
MSSYAISVIKDKKVNSMFVKANSFVLKKHSSKFNNHTSQDLKIKILKQLWKDELSADLVFDGCTPVEIYFSNKSHMLLFELNFGS